HPAEDCDRDVQRRPLQVWAADGTVVDVVPPRSAVRRVPARERDVIAGVDSHAVVGQRDNQQQSIDAEDRPGDCARGAVPIQNLNPNVLTMESAEDWYCCDAADLLRPPKIRSIFMRIIQPEFPFSISTDTRRSANGTFKPGFECKAPPIAPVEAGFASGGHATSGKRHFPTEFSDTSHYPHTLRPRDRLCLTLHLSG